MATAKKTQIVITANAATAKKVMDELQQRIDALKQRMAALDVTTSQGQKEFKKLEKELVSYNSAVTQNVTNTERINKAMKNLAGTSLNELKRALSAAKSELGKMSANSSGLKQMQNNVKAIQNQIDKLNNSVKNHGSAWQTAMKNLTAYVGLFSAFNMVKQKMKEILNLNFKLSDQLADIRKVSGWAMEDVNELSKRLAKIDTRNSIQELNNLAYEGAKLGIGKYGVDGLERFAEATAQIRMALHEDMGDESIGQLAKMAEVMHDMDNLGVSQSLLAAGSAIFKLSATTTSTGTNIMEFSKRLLGLGKTADLTTPQILALGSAADTMALMPEVASTAFNKFITTLQSKYGGVAKAVGMNQKRLKSLLDQHQTMQAIVEVLEHMRSMGDLNALAPIMGDLGSEGARLTNVFASMAANVDMLKEQLATSEDEFKKATAITAEFDIQNETAQALLERANNIWAKSFVNSDNAAGGVKEIAKAWYDMTTAITNSKSFMLEANLLLSSLGYGIKILIGALPGLINGLIYLGAVKLASWAAWPTIINAVSAGFSRAGLSLLSFIGIQTASQKTAILTATSNQAAAEALYAEALAAKEAAVTNDGFVPIMGQEAAIAERVAAANADLAAAQQLLAESTVELSAATGQSTAALLAESEEKIRSASTTQVCAMEDIRLAESEGMSSAMTSASTAALEKETVAKEVNTTATKNLSLAWNAVLFIAAISLIDKLCDNLEQLNAEEERNKEITDKVANGIATANKEYEDACKNLRVLYDELRRNWNQMDERKRIIGEINSKYGEYVGNLIDEKTKIGELTTSYNNATTALRRYYFYKQKEALRADLVTEEQHRGDVAFVKLQNMGGDYAKWNISTMRNLIKNFARNGGTSATIANQIWQFLYGTKPPSDWYVDLSKVPLVGGFFKKDTFRSTEQEAMNYLHEMVKSYVSSWNNEYVIEENFPGEWTPPKRDDKDSKDNWVDKKGVAAAKKAAAEAKRKEEEARRKQIEDWRNDLKSQKDQANAIIDNVTNFYNRQINAKQAKANELGLADVEQKQYLEPIKKRKNEALSEVRRAIAGKDNDWDDFKKTIKDRDLIEEADETGINLSEVLLNDILNNNIEALHSKMGELSKNLEIPLSSVLAEVFSNATKNEGDNLKLEAEQLKARRKAAMDHDYIGAVQQSIYEQFNTLGYAEPTEDDLSTKLNHDLYRKYIIGIFETARQNIATLYSIDPSTQDGQGLLIKFLFGDDPTNMGARIEGVLGSDIAQWQLFYSKLVQYSDEYTEAQKKMYDEAKKVAEQLWKVNRKNLAMQKGQERMQRQGDAFGKRTNFLSNLGLKDLTADPEVQLMKMRMQAAQDYYEFLERHTKNQQLKDEAEKSRQEAELAYAKKLAEAMKDRLSQMKSLVAPIEEFGSAVGQAFAEMRNDVDSAHEAIKNALKSMLMSWGNMAIGSFSTQMWKAINDAGVKSVKPKSDADIAAGRARAVATAQTAEITNLGTAENPMYVRLVDGHFVPIDEKGEPVTGNQSTQPSSQNQSQEHDVPAAWRKRNPGKTAEDYRLEASGATAIASNVGEATAGVITGQGSFETVAGSLAGSAINTALNTDFSSSKSEKKRKKELRAERQHQKELTKAAKSGIKDREKATKKGVDAISTATQEGSEAQTMAESVKNEAITAGLNTALNKQLAAKKTNNAEVAQEDATLAEQETTFSMVGAISKCFEFLGPIAGPIAAATVTATLMGLLQWALSSAFKSKKTSTTGPTAKVKSGMLTYDNGNVQDLKPFVADNGDVYWAKEDNVRSGVNLLSTPTATTINGQPSIVAEKGPELVIGRETTQAMMMNNPSLLKALVNYDANYSGRRAYDAGNVADSLGNVNNGANENVINNNTASNAALLQAVSMLLTRLNEPINAQINMYGTGGLYESTRKANQFMSGKNR